MPTGSLKRGELNAGQVGRRSRDLVMLRRFVSDCRTVMVMRRVAGCGRRLCDGVNMPRARRIADLDRDWRADQQKSDEEANKPPRHDSHSISAIPVSTCKLKC